MKRGLLFRRLIVGSIGLMVLIQAFYHLATGGLPSFVAEITMALVLGTIFGLSFLNSAHTYKRAALIIERCLLISVATVLFAAGIYHGTHQGYYSGVLQPIGAILLGTAAYLSFR